MKALRSQDNIQKVMEKIEKQCIQLDAISVRKRYQITFTGVPTVDQ